MLWNLFCLGFYFELRSRRRRRRLRPRLWNVRGESCDVGVCVFAMHRVIRCERKRWHAFDFIKSGIEPFRLLLLLHFRLGRRAWTSELKTDEFIWLVVLFSVFFLFQINFRGTHDCAWDIMRNRTRAFVHTHQFSNVWILGWHENVPNAIDTWFVIKRQLPRIDPDGSEQFRNEIGKPKIDLNMMMLFLFIFFDLLSFTSASIDELFVSVSILLVLSLAPETHSLVRSITLCLSISLDAAFASKLMASLRTHIE